MKVSEKSRRMKNPNGEWADLHTHTHNNIPVWAWNHSETATAGAITETDGVVQGRHESFSCVQLVPDTDVFSTKASLL